MTTNTYRIEAAEIIEEAYDLIGHESRTGYDLRRARRSLNIILNDWANRGINLWKITRFAECLVAGQDSVLLEEGDIDIIDAAIRYNGQDYPLERTVRADYLSIPRKYDEGRPTELYMERTIVPKVYVWPIPATTGDYEFIAYRLQNINTVENNTADVDIPSRFLYALITALAFQLALKAAPERAEGAALIADDALGRAINEDSERASLFITPMVC